MKQSILVVSILCLAALVWGQWSSDASSPLLIAGGPGEQSMPKVAVCANGNTYISYFDNATGGYKVWLKLLDMDGYELWPSPVEMTGSISDSWLTDYAICVDQEDNALICFQDIRLGYNSIFVYKVSQQGEQLWAENGLSLSINASMDYPDYTPVLLNTSDNDTFVAWQHQGSPATIAIQNISSNGQIAWQDGLIMTAGIGENCNWPQLLESENGDVLMKYYVDSGPFYSPNRILKVARYSAEGELIWDQTISDALGIAAWTQVIGFAPDGSGGAVLSWHDDRDMNSINQAYFARITASGEITTPENGAAISSTTGYQHFYPWVDCDPELQEARVAMRVTSADQNNYGAIFQRLDYSGNRLISDAGYILQELSGFDHNPIYAKNMRARFHYLYSRFNSTSPNVEHIHSSHNEIPGLYDAWNTGGVATAESAKLHYSFASHLEDWVIMGYEDDSGDRDIYAMRYWYNGNVGECKDGPQNVTAEFIHPSGVLIEWDTPAFSDPDSYIVQLGEFTFQVPNTDTQYTIDDVEPGFYQVLVFAVYGDDHVPQNEYVEINVSVNSDPVQSPVSLMISPNPFCDNARISWQTRKSGTSSLGLYNIRGQQVLSLKIYTGIGINSYLLQKDKLASGLYFLRLQSPSGSVSRKVLILH